MEILLLALLLGVGALSGLFGSGDSDDGGNNGGSSGDDRVIEGNDQANEITGSARGDDLIFGNGGNDMLRGWSGDDIIVGGDGNDMIRGDAGDDLGLGGTGNDTVLGWEGNDFLSGGAGSDVVRGGDGNDTLIDIAGADLLEGGNGNDRIDAVDRASEAATPQQIAQLETELRAVYGDQITPEMVQKIVEARSLSGPAGADTLRGGDGSDTLLGNSGDDMSGGGDNDLFIVRFDGSATFDRVLIRDFDPNNESIQIRLEQGVTEGPLTVGVVDGVTRDAAIRMNGQTIIRLSNTSPSDIDLSRIEVIGFNENIPERLLPPVAPSILSGTAGAETLAGTDTTRDLLLGFDGADTLTAGGRPDMVVGGLGNDLMRGDAGSDTLLGGAGNDTLEGGEGTDNLVGGAGTDSLSGGDGDDVLAGISGANTLEGGAGADTLIGLDFAAPLAFDELELRNSLRSLYGEGVTAAQGTEVVDNARSFAAGSAGDVLRGDTGNDLIVADSGDTVIGGAGDDTYYVMYGAGPGNAAWTGPVVVQEYNVTNEQLRVATTTTLAAQPVTYVQVGADTIMRIGDVDVVRFVDRTVEAIRDGRLTGLSAGSTTPSVGVQTEVPAEVVRAINGLVPQA